MIPFIKCTDEHFSIVNMTNKGDYLCPDLEKIKNKWVLKGKYHDAVRIRQAVHVTKCLNNDACESDDKI